MSILTIENQAGEPIQAGANRLVPFSQVRRLRSPGLRGGLVWNRPVSVLVQSADGSESVLAIPYPTRQAQLTCLGAAVAAVLIYNVLRAFTRRNS